MAKKEYYTARIECENCGAIVYVDIEKGMWIEEYLNKHNPTCRNCRQGVRKHKYKK